MSHTKEAARGHGAAAPRGAKRKARTGKRAANLELMNRETGEVIAVMEVPKRDRIRGRFFMVIQDSLEWLAIHDDLSHDARRVMLFMLARLDFDNHMRASQTLIASELGVDKSRVSRAVKELLKCNLIRPGEQIGRTTFYRVSPVIGWKGKPGERAEMGVERARARLKRLCTRQADERGRRRRSRRSVGGEGGEGDAPPAMREES